MVKTKKMNCGINIIWEEIENSLSTAMGIWVKVGSSDESTNISGISHFIEHLKFKSTNKRTTKELALDMDKTGGHWNAMTGKEYTCYHCKVIKEKGNEAADVLIDLFANSKYDNEDMQKERDVVIEEMRMIEDNSDEYCHELLGENVFKGSLYAQSILGSEESIKKIERSDILSYIEDKYTQDMITVVVVGSFDINKLENIFNEGFNLLQKRKGTKEIVIPEYSPSYISKVKDIEQAHICLGTKSISARDEEYYTLITLNNLIGGSFSSRLFQNIREEKGLAYSVYSGWEALINDGMFYIYAGVNKNKVDIAIQGIKEEFTKLKKLGISNEELELAKTQMKTNIIFGQENVNSRMFSLGRNIILRDKIITREEIIKQVDNVNMERINKIIDRITNFEMYSGVVINDREEDIQKYITM